MKLAGVLVDSALTGKQLPPEAGISAWDRPAVARVSSLIGIMSPEKRTYATIEGTRHGQKGWLSGDSCSHQKLQFHAPPVDTSWANILKGPGSLRVQSVEAVTSYGGTACGCLKTITRMHIKALWGADDASQQTLLVATLC